MDEHVCTWAVHGLDYDMVPMPGSPWPVMRFRERQECTGCHLIRWIRLRQGPEDEPVVFDRDCECLSCRNGRAEL